VVLLSRYSSLADSGHGVCNSSISGGVVVSSYTKYLIWNVISTKQSFTAHIPTGTTRTI
jgi:hypothetical protein